MSPREPSSAREVAGVASVEPDAETYNAFIAALELTGIETAKVQGERTAPGEAAQTRFDLSVGYMLNEGMVQYRYDLTANFLGESGASLGSASTSVLLAASNASTDDVKCIEHFGATSGALMVHPYLREVIASTAQRIGFPGILLPLVKHQLNTAATAACP